MSLLEEMYVRHTCPICESSSTVSVFRMPFTSPPISDFLIDHYEERAELSRISTSEFAVNRCDHCHFIFQSTIPTGTLLNDIYDKWIPATENTRLHKKKQLSDYRYLAGQIEFLIQQLAMKPYDVHALDFGMGWADWTNMARAYGIQVSGSELSTERIDYAQSLGHQVLTWTEIPQQEFHFINTEQVFEHLISPRETLQHLVKALSPNGLIRISVPDARGMEKKLKALPTMSTLPEGYLMPIQPLEHVNGFTYESLVALGQQAGLKPICPSFRALYNGSSGWLEAKQLAKNLLRPIIRHLFPKSTVVYFAKNRHH